MPRHYIVSYELQGFPDASKKAYGCCLYLKCLILTVLNLFKGEIDISGLYAWSDSKVSLAWIES